MKLTIKEDIIGPAIAFGVDDEGNEYRVFGGDLYYGETIEVEPCKENTKIFAVPKINYESIEIFSKYFDRDGLIDLNTLNEVKGKSKPFNRIYLLRKWRCHVEGTRCLWRRS